MPQNPSEPIPPSNGHSGKNAAGQTTPTTKNAAAKNDVPQKNGEAQPNADPLAMIRADHPKVEQLFGAFEKAKATEEKYQLVEQICHELMIHTMLEEEIFYPACQGHMERSEERTSELQSPSVRS